ncbi:MAG: hypothetical protein C4542_00015 [Dehalococcoidia bacterium]|nr:MAG: hypothetical protein C4542_00015 [Dehalococcoidia bacterium]
MAIEGQVRSSHKASKTQSTYIDEITAVVGELDSLLEEMKQTLEIVRLTVGEVESPAGGIMLKSP